MTMMIIVVMLATLHFIADFVMQSHERAVGKSTSLHHLCMHAYEYSGWMVAGLIIIKFAVSGMAGVGNILWQICYFGFITMVLHGVTDYFTSKLNKRLWESGNMHNFFVGIGFDQLLHAIQLIITFVFVFER